MILKSRWFPRFLSWWLIVNGIAYLVLSFAGMFVPAAQYGTIVHYSWSFLFGEIAFTLWALIIGAKESVATTATQS